MSRYSYPHRTLCDALNEMRECFKTFNFAPIPGLIEEAQSMGNRMEAALYYQRDIRDLENEREELLKSVEAVRKAQEHD